MEHPSANENGQLEGIFAQTEGLAYLVVDENGHIVNWYGELGKILNGSLAIQRGMSIQILLGSGYDQGVILDQVLELGRVELVGRSGPEGDRVYYGMVMQPLAIRGSERPGFSVILVDKNHAHAEAIRKTLFLKVNEVISHTSNLPDALEASLKQIIDFTGWEYGEIWINDAEKAQLRHSKISYTNRKKLQDFGKQSFDVVFKYGHGLPGLTAEANEPQWIDDVSKAPSREFVRQDLARSLKLKAAFAIPISSAHEVLGVFTFFLSKPQKRSSHLVELIRYVTLQIGPLLLQKQVQDKLKVANRQLMISNREMQQFAYISSHDLKSPVANLLGLVSILDRMQAVKPEYVEVFTRLKSSVNQMDETIQSLNEILRFRSTLQIPPEQVKIPEIVETVERELGFQIGEKNALISKQFGVEEIQFPRIHFKSVVQNLVSNSLKYVRPGVRPHINLATFRRKGKIFFQIQDNGLGIDLKLHKNRLFELFRRFHEGHDGSGVGLYTVKSIVDSYGANISVASKLNKGTTFKIDFGHDKA